MDALHRSSSTSAVSPPADGPGLGSLPDGCARFWSCPASFVSWRRSVAMQRAVTSDDDWESKTGQKGRRKEAYGFQRTPRSASANARARAGSAPPPRRRCRPRTDAGRTPSRTGRRTGTRRRRLRRPGREGGGLAGSPPGPARGNRIAHWTRVPKPRPRAAHPPPAGHSQLPARRRSTLSSLPKAPMLTRHATVTADSLARFARLGRSAAAGRPARPPSAPAGRSAARGPRSGSRRHAPRPGT